jgi:hypothetical protein
MYERHRAGLVEVLGFVGAGVIALKGLRSFATKRVEGSDEGAVAHGRALRFCAPWRGRKEVGTLTGGYSSADV